MKKAEDIKVGDTFWYYTGKNGFEEYGKVEKITEPNSHHLVYSFKLENMEFIEINMWPNSLYSTTARKLGFFIVPEDKQEIKFLNEVLLRHYKIAQDTIANGIKDLLGIND